MSNVRTQIGKVIRKSLNGYHGRVKPKIDELKFKEQYQGRIIDCMVGEVDDNYIETPLTDENSVKLEHSKEGVIKIPQIKGKTILIDEDGNETDTPGEGCRLVSVGEEEDNKLIILSKNSDSSLHHKTEILLKNPLRKLPNGVCDEIVGNKIIRRVGKVTWGKLEDGATRHSTDYAWGGSSDTETHYIIGICVRNHNWDVYIEGSSTTEKYVICDKLQPYAITSFDVGSSNQRGYLLMKLPKEEIEGSCTTTKIKEWLDKNVPTLIYPLAEPIIEELPNSITLQGFDDTTMYIENSITPTVQYGYNALIPYKQELLNQKEEVETNTLDIEQNIIPYLMDMEFNLMLMEDNE